MEEIPDEEGRAIGGATIGGGILEDSRDDEVEEKIEQKEDATEVPMEVEEKAPQLCVVKANRAL